MYKNVLKDFENKFEKFKKEFEQTDFTSKGFILDGKFRKIEKIIDIRKEYGEFEVAYKIKGMSGTYVDTIDRLIDVKDYKQTLLKRKKERVKSLKKLIASYTENLKQLEEELENGRV